MRQPQKTFEDVLDAWAPFVPADMMAENAKDKLLDAFLRLFENLSAASLETLPPKIQLFRLLQRAVHWQWIALDIAWPPLLSNAAPGLLALAAMRWLRVWQSDKTPGNQRLMATLDHDLGCLFAAAQYVFPTQ